MKTQQLLIFIFTLQVAFCFTNSFTNFRTNFRYITIGREKSRETATKSETATTFDDKQSTEMQLLPQDSDMIASVSNRPRNSLSSDEKGEPTTYETTIFHFNRPNADLDDEAAFCDAGTGVSSFLPHPPLRRNNSKPQNAESAYSSLDDEQEDVVNFPDVLHEQETHTQTLPDTDTSNCTSAQLVKQLSIDDERALTTNLPSHQFKANDDSYAIVNKVQDQRHTRIKHSTEQNNIRQSVKNTCIESEIPCHIHTVPEHVYPCDQLSQNTMQLIPEHDCLLHKIPPPPPPPLRLNYVDSSSNNNSVQANV